ncbi:MAG: anti-sigma factor family protein [Thermodesulfobacteriota bacterium]
MFCSKARSCLHRYLGDELPERQKRKLEAHLQTCPDCRNELEETRKFSYLLRQSSNVVQAAPEGFARRTVSRAMWEKQDKKPVTRFYLFTPEARTRVWRAAVAASLMLGLGLGTFLGQATWQNTGGQNLSAAEKNKGVDPLSTFGMQEWSDSSSQSISVSFARLVSSPENKGE